MKSWKLTIRDRGKSTNPEVLAKLVRIMFGINVTLVPGYPGANEVGLAVERGEADGMCGFAYASFGASRRSLLVDNKVSLLMQAALACDVALPANVPMLCEKTTSQSQRQALELILTPQGAARPIAAPPRTLVARGLVLRNDFTATMADPEFLKDAGTYALDVDPIDGGKMVERYRKVCATLADAVAEASRSAGN